jgi:NADH:ubiquinone oxidoreductase subunit K
MVLSYNYFFFYIYDGLNIYLLSELQSIWIIFLGFYLIFLGLFSIIFLQKSLINLLISVELIVMGQLILLIIFSVITNNFISYLYAFIIIILAAVESVLGLSLSIVIFRVKNYTFINNLSFLKG